MVHLLTGPSIELLCMVAQGSFKELAWQALWDILVLRNIGSI